MMMLGEQWLISLVAMDPASLLQWKLHFTTAQML
jgi:hypothetical protein